MPESTVATVLMLRAAWSGSMTERELAGKYTRRLQANRTPAQGGHLRWAVRMEFGTRGADGRTKPTARAAAISRARTRAAAAGG